MPRAGRDENGIAGLGLANVAIDFHAGGSLQ